MTPPSENRDTRQAILDAAAVIFARYGIRRARMDDIANTASLSRATVYNYFDNKEALFGALIEQQLSNVLVEMKAALEGPGDLWARVESAIHVQAVAPFKRLEGVHADEIMDATRRIAGGFTARSTREVRRLYAATLQSAADRGEIVINGTTAKELAELIHLSLRGFRSDGFDSRRFSARVRTLVTVLDRATRPRPTPSRSTKPRRKGAR